MAPLDADGYGVTGNSECLCATSGSYTAIQGGDCLDSNAAVHPGATETCNGIDDNCNGQTDEGVLTTYYRDFDGDGYGNPNSSVQACSTPAGYVLDNTDCDDSHASVYPGATEICDGLDNNCNGLTDESGAATTYYRDGDNDGFGDPNSPITSCSPPSGYVISSNDCNDNDFNIKPGATEICDGVDNNCNGQTDEGFGTGVACGTGACAGGMTVCNATHNGSVCSTAGNASAETCNGVDDNCDGTTDEGFGVGVACGVGACAGGTTLCNATHNGNVCSTAGNAVAEICNGIDDNCNGQTDEGFSTTTYYQDADGDGYGNPNVSVKACSKPTGYVTNKTDCDDTDKNVNPSLFGGFLQETPKFPYGLGAGCNGKDNDCNGYTDDAMAFPYYKDNDGDSYGAASSGSQSVCIGTAGGTGWVRDGADCNDANAAIHPNAPDLTCDGTDEDCIAGDNCDATCTAHTLYDFQNGPQGWSLPSDWCVFQYVNLGSPPSLYLGYEKESKNGYQGYNSGTSTSSTLLSIPNHAGHIQFTLYFNNSTYDDTSGSSDVYTPDTTAYVTLSVGGVTTQYGPLSSYDGSSHTLTIAVNSAWWNTQQTVSMTVTNAGSSTDTASGYFIDNVKAVCP